MLYFLFLSLSLSLSLLIPPIPHVQVCNVNIKKSTFSLECCRQSVSGRVQFLQGVRALQADRQTKLILFDNLKKRKEKKKEKKNSLYLHLLEV